MKFRGKDDYRPKVLVAFSYRFTCITKALQPSYLHGVQALIYLARVKLIFKMNFHEVIHCLVFTLYGSLYLHNESEPRFFMEVGPSCLETLHSNMTVFEDIF